MKKIFFLPLLFLCMLATMLSCEKEIKITGTPSPFISLNDVRALYKDSPTVLTADDMLGATFIGGVVISDPVNGNAPEGLVILQNHRRTLLRGIALAMGEAAADYHSGDSLLVMIEGKTLERVNGILQISDILTDDVTRISIDNPTHVNIEATTFTDITRWFDTYESTLVSIRNVMMTDMESGDVFEGTKTASDGFNTMSVTTLPTASFAAEEIPGYGNYTGIMLQNTAEEPVLMLRNGNDYEVMSLEPPNSGELYENFPEGFENESLISSRKGGYTTGSYETYLSGEWIMTRCYTLSSANLINKTGTWAVMMQNNQTAVLGMNWNFPYGASRFRFEYGVATGTDQPPMTIDVYYSQDSGASWQQIGSSLNITTQDKYIFDEELDIKGPVRFKIEKTGTAARVSIDAVSVWQN